MPVLCFFKKDELNRLLLTQNIDSMFLKDAGEGGAGGPLSLLPFDRMGKGGQSDLETGHF